MIEFIVKYWLQFLFAGIISVLSVLCKKFWSLYQKEKEHQKTKEQEEFYNGLKQAIADSYADSKRDDEELQSQIDGINEMLVVVKNGLLSLQGREFKELCKVFLEDDHVITLEEWLLIEREHEIYNSLGGNHDGDALFNLAKMKYENSL